MPKLARMLSGGSDRFCNSPAYLELIAIIFVQSGFKSRSRKGKHTRGHLLKNYMQEIVPCQNFFFKKYLNFSNMNS